MTIQAIQSVDYLGFTSVRHSGFAISTSFRLYISTSFRLHNQHITQTLRFSMVIPMAFKNVFIPEQLFMTYSTFIFFSDSNIYCLFFWWIAIFYSYFCALLAFVELKRLVWGLIFCFSFINLLPINSWYPKILFIVVFFLNIALFWVYILKIDRTAWGYSGFEVMFSEFLVSLFYLPYMLLNYFYFMPKSL